MYCRITKWSHAWSRGDKCLCILIIVCGYQYYFGLYDFVKMIWLLMKIICGICTFIIILIYQFFSVMYYFFGGHTDDFKLIKIVRLENTGWKKSTYK